MVAAALVDGRGRVLVQQRPPGTSMAGLWEFPGGKVEAGETPERALCRELHEELAIAAHDLEPLTFVTAPLGERELVMLLYRCNAWDGVPQPLHATALQWRRASELRALPMPPADLPLISFLEVAI